MFTLGAAILKVENILRKAKYLLAFADEKDH